MRQTLILRFQYLVLFLYSALIVVALPLGFDQHHSGLIHTTLLQYKSSLLIDGDYPFNQYGPAWIAIFHFFLVLAPIQLYFFFTKVIGLLCIFISMLITYKLARLFLSKIWAMNCILFMLVTYPFFTGFLPWPSLLVMPIVPYIAYVFVKLASSDTFRYAEFHYFLAGASIGVATFTRAQIGFMLILVCSFILSQHWRQKSIRPLLGVILGLGTSTFAIVLCLLHKGWLKAALYDEFVLGFKYVTGDKSTFPFPLGTISLVTLLLAFFFLVSYSSTLKRIYSSFNSGVFKNFIFISFASLMLSFFYNERVFNRFWISLILSVFLFFLITKLFPPKNLNRVSTSPLNVLVIFSGVALLQVWPLFDQLHAWWSITPVTVLLFIFLKLKLPKRTVDSVITSTLAVSVLVFLSFQIQSVVNTYRQSSEISINSLNLNFSSQLNVDEMESIQEFFALNIPQGGRVLNLCADGNLFFTPENYSSSARNTVFWSTMKDNADLFQNILASKPQYLVKCNFTPFTSQQYDFEKLQENITRQLFKESVVLSELRLNNSKSIQIVIMKPTY